MKTLWILNFDVYTLKQSKIDQYSETEISAGLNAGIPFAQVRSMH
jgi:hypothetical protein